MWQNERAHPPPNQPHAWVDELASDEKTDGKPVDTSAGATADGKTDDKPTDASVGATADGKTDDKPADATAGATADGKTDDKPADATAGATADGKPESKPRRKVHNPVLMRAYRSGRPVEGTILRVIKGGYEVRIGKARGFCPHSQVDLHRENHPEEQVGKSYPFRVTQLRRGGEDVVLSRRVLLEEDRADEAKAVRATLVEGAVMQGHVAGTADFGAFIDLGAGVTGLVHI